MTAQLSRIALIAFILALISLRAAAPGLCSVIIFDTGPVEPYKPLILAIGLVETMCDTLAYNPKEEAAGYFQIRPIRLEEYNRLTRASYTAKDLFNYEISEKIFLYFADRIGPYDFEQIAKKWNGSGSMTDFYWSRIKEKL
jgi:hypothetical protein